MNGLAASPVAEIFDALRSSKATWAPEITTPAGAGWVAGTALRSATEGPFNAILERIGERARTQDRRTIAASFALRYGWASAMAIAPYLRFHCVPDVSLENVSFKFRESTFLERTAIYEARGTVVAGDGRAAHPTMSTVADDAALLRTLRAALVSQSEAVVDALFHWSGFAHRGTWGLLTSSWASQFTALCENRDDHRSIRPQLEALFEGNDIVYVMRPRMEAVTYGRATHLYQRRSSCCRYYLLPDGELCASCPLVPNEDRLTRNREWMRAQAERGASPRGHE